MCRVAPSGPRGVNSELEPLRLQISKIDNDIQKHVRHLLMRKYSKKRKSGPSPLFAKNELILRAKLTNWRMFGDLMRPLSTKCITLLMHLLVHGWI